MNPDELEKELSGLSHAVRKLDGEVRKSTRLVKVTLALIVVIVVLVAFQTWVVCSRVPASSQAVAGGSTQLQGGKVEKDDLLAELDKVFQPQGSQSNFGPDPRVAPAVGVLVKAVVRLDKSSGFLAVVNICLTVALLFQGFATIWLMVKGR